MSGPISDLAARGGLRGRGDECALLDDLVSAVRRGESRSLLLRGEAGIGKSALLHYLIAVASDLTVVRTVGIESEMELAYAGLHQLCSPLLQWLDKLPAPQREAIEIVFGLRTGSAPDRFFVGLAALGLLAGAGGERPGAFVVGDRQRLGPKPAVTFSFF